MYDQRSFLKLADNMENFLSTLRKSAKMMNTVERQKVLRLVVKEILIDDDRIKIKHSIPLPKTDMQIESFSDKNIPSYLLRKGSGFPDLKQYLSTLCT